MTNRNYTFEIKFMGSAYYRLVFRWSKSNPEEMHDIGSLRYCSNIARLGLDITRKSSDTLKYIILRN